MASEKWKIDNHSLWVDDGSKFHGDDIPFQEPNLSIDARGHFDKKTGLYCLGDGFGRVSVFFDSDKLGRSAFDYTIEFNILASENQEAEANLLRPYLRRTEGILTRTGSIELEYSMLKSTARAHGVRGLDMLFFRRNLQNAIDNVLDEENSRETVGKALVKRYLKDSKDVPCFLDRLLQHHNPEDLENKVVELEKYRR